jgi:hypothetical protein
MSEIRGTLLYEAATNALASDASGENTWTKMVTASFAHGSDRTAFYKELRTVEKQIKTEYALKSMPGAWRGAKSIVLAAMLAAIPMADENGKIRGKTSVQDALKASVVEKPKDPFIECKKRVEWITNNRHLLNDAETMSLVACVKILLETL